MGVDNVFTFSLQTAVRRLSVIPACVSLLLASAGALAQTATNQASVTPPAGIINTGTSCTAPRTFDAATGTCTAVDTDAVVASADLSLVKTLTTAGPYIAGQSVSYDIVLSNAGPSEAVNVVVSDTPTNLTITGLSGACTALPCTIPTLASGASASITVTATVGVAGGDFNNAATVGSDTPDPDPDNNTDDAPGVSTIPTIDAVDDDRSDTPVDGGTGGTLPPVLGNDSLNDQPIPAGGVVLTPGTSPNPGILMNPDGSITVAPGTQPGTYQYPYTICEAARPTHCDSAIATIVVEGDAGTIRVSKTANPRDAKVGDLVRYTVTLENLSNAPIVDATLVDVPPAGFSYVAASLAVADLDNAGRLVGTAPIRVDQIDIATGGRATVQYLLRVGAGVRPGAHVNSASALDNGLPASNTATASVQLIGDPLLDEALILGTVFDDRDGDGWQDSAALRGLQAQGGFAPGVYVANSTTVDAGQGAVAQADASSPLLHGLAVGDLPGRQSEAEPVGERRIVISQLLRTPQFTDDFVLTTAQGLRLHMDAAGNTRVDGEDDRSAAMPQVTRTVSQVDGGYRVDYVIANAGIDERGIPGVRIAAVEGLLVETDQYGRYHLAGLDGGRWERGRNLILKVDAATLPPGSRFTTANPLLRRVTPGLPVRFDFGVQLPSGLLPGRQDQVELQLGEVLFEPGSAELPPQADAVIERMAEEVRQRGRGEVVLSASGETAALAYDRAHAVQAALLQRLDPALARDLTVTVRTDAADPASGVVSLGRGTLLGTVLFDTDQSAIRPEFEPLIDRIAAEIDAMGSGTVSVVGHADQRGATAYNDALGLRRAKAVHDAIAQRLRPEVRARLRVDIRNNPKAPVGTNGR